MNNIIEEPRPSNSGVVNAGISGKSGAYAKIGRTSTLQAIPSVIHFGGYRLKRKHQQRLQIVNVSNESIRVTVMPAQTTFFNLRYKNGKKGLIAPGMVEEFLVEFTPTEWKYYYDCVRFHCHDENILVPIHGYPVMNDVLFPRDINMGRCPLGITTERVIPLECKVPIQFEFEFTIEEEHPDFEVVPMKGIVPANGAIGIKIRFHPLKLSTVQTKLRLDISQFNFKPYTIVISGSAGAGMTKEIADAGAKREFERKLSTMTVEQPPKIPVKDPAANHISEKRRKRYERLKKLGKLPSQMRKTGVVNQEEQETKLEGLRIPTKETFEKGGVKALNFILTQKKGHLKPKDLKNAIAEQRALRERQQAATQKMRDAMESAGDENGASLPSKVIVAAERGDGSDQPRQLRELAFLQDIADIDKAESAREFQSIGEHIGEPLLSAGEIKEVRLARQEKRRNDKRRFEAAARDATETISLGPYQTPPTRVEVLIDTHPEFEPTFDPYQNDVWGMRKQVLKRFSECVTKVCIRKRSDERIASILRRLGDAKTPEAVQALVEYDNKQKRAASKVAADAARAALSTTTEEEGDKTEPVAFVIQREGPPEEYAPGGAGKVPGESRNKSKRALNSDISDDKQLVPFHEYAYFRLKEPKEYIEHGYTEIPIPALQSYVPKPNRQIENGAPEEAGALLSREEVESSIDEDTINVNDEVEESNDKKVLKRENVDPSEMSKAQEGMIESDKLLKYVQMPQAKAAGLLEMRRELPALARFPQHVETDPHYALRPVSGLRDIPAGGADETVEVCKETTRGLVCSAWRSTYRPKMLATEAKDDEVPKELERALPEDDLSDSDTDSEDDVGHPLKENELLLTPSLARSLYDDVKVEFGEQNLQSTVSCINHRVRTPGSVEPNSAAAAAEEHAARDAELKRGNVPFDVERDQALLRLAKNIKERRENTLNRLPEAAMDFAETLHHPYSKAQVLDWTKISGYEIW
eukprot:g1125.t1